MAVVQTIDMIRYERESDVMGERNFFTKLSNADRIRFRFIVDHGVVISFIVQYETMIDGVFHPVVRYDTAHGHPHKDTMTASGQDKEWLPGGWSNAQALTFAQNDLNANWESYRDMFLESK